MQPPRLFSSLPYIQVCVLRFSKNTLLPFALYTFRFAKEARKSFFRNREMQKYFPLYRLNEPPIFLAHFTRAVGQFPESEKFFARRERARLAAAAAQMETENSVENGRGGEEWKTGHEWGLIKPLWTRSSTSVKWPSVEKRSDARTNTHVCIHTCSR